MLMVTKSSEGNTWTWAFIKAVLDIDTVQIESGEIMNHIVRHDKWEGGLALAASVWLFDPGARVETTMFPPTQINRTKHKRSISMHRRHILWSLSNELQLWRMCRRELIKFCDGWSFATLIKLTANKSNQWISKHKFCTLFFYYS